MEQLIITEENIDSYIAQTDLPFIVDFSAIWSKPCLMYKAYILRAMDNLHSRAYWGSIDIDISPKIAERFSIITIPTTLVFYQGQLVRQLIGVQDIDTFKKVLDELVPVAATN
jgi:thioredoxin 1